jgi:hypothetical protein
LKAWPADRPGIPGWRSAACKCHPRQGAQYRYRLLLAQTGDKKDKEFNGVIQLGGHRAAAARRLL